MEVVYTKWGLVKRVHLVPCTLDSRMVVDFVGSTSVELKVRRESDVAVVEEVIDSIEVTEICRLTCGQERQLQRFPSKKISIR